MECLSWRFMYRCHAAWILAAGLLLALAVRNERLWNGIARGHKATLYLALGISGVGVAALISRPPHGRAIVIAGYTLLALFYGLLLACAIWFPDSWMGSVFRFRPLRKLGGIAFGVYLIHQAVNWMAHGVFLHSGPEVDGMKALSISLGSLAVSLAIAVTSWKYLEQPLIKRVRRHFAY